MGVLIYLLLLLIMVIATIVLVIYYLALKSKVFDWSWVEDSWHTEAPWFYPWTGGPYGIRNEIRRDSEPFRYALKAARMKLTPEEKETLREASEEGGFEAFKRALDLMAASLEKGVSPDEYAEHHRKKERDMR